MTLRDDVQSILINCFGQPRKRLLLRFPVDSAQTIIDNTNNSYLDLFELSQFDNSDTDDYIYLKVFPQYDSETEQLGDNSFKNTFNSSAIIAPSQVRRGFKATVTDNRLVILDLIFYLSLISKSTSYTRYHPIKIIDFCSPEITDNFIFNQEKATIRYGSVFVDNIPEMIQIGRAEYAKRNWQFTFKESSLRLI